MKGLIQRVQHARVDVDNALVAAIDAGLLLLLGIEAKDDCASADRLLYKISHYRIFNDAAGRMNRNLQQAGGGLLVVSQFTLVAETDRGLRPGFSRGATPQQAQKLYDYFVRTAEAQLPLVASGIFAADMQVSLCNDGPVTFLLET